MSADESRPIALVIGGARRVGLAIAHEFAQTGVDLILTFKSSEREANEAQASLTQAGVAVRLERLDLDQPNEVEAFCRRISDTTPRLDALVLSAARYEPTPIKQLTASDALAHYTVNALSPLLMCKHLSPLLARSPLTGGGSIVAMADIHAMGRPRIGFSAYSMSKAALVEMVRSLARELAPKVRVNGIAPGVIAWPESGYESEGAAQQRYIDRVPLGRAGTPADAARLARFLALEAAYVTGQIIALDGGRSLA